jgi:hypothetical protein
MCTKFLSEILKGETHRRPRCRQKDTIKMDLKGIRYGDSDWIHLA